MPGQLYDELRCELQRIRERFLPEEKAIEACFAVVLSKEKELAAWERQAVFEDQAAEIEFYKHVHPRFASLIEYYKRRYQAMLFLPRSKKEQVRFYEYEIDKVEKYFLDNAGLYHYYKSGCTDRDREYFLQDNGSKTLAVIIGLEQYKEYVQQELEKLKT